MGAKQSLHTANTFITVSAEERSKIDESFMTDPRMNKTWSGSSPQNFIREVDSCATVGLAENEGKVSDPDVVRRKDNNACGALAENRIAVEPRGISLAACLQEDVAAPTSNKVKSASASTEPTLRKTKVDVSLEDSCSSDEDQCKWTTRMVRNLPNDYLRQDVLDFLDGMGVQYDFIYLPMDWGRKANLGYAFVNLISPAEACRVEAVLSGFCRWRTSSDKKCEVVWGKADQQTLLANVDRFRNSPVMHPDVPDEFKPMIFTLGRRTPFPPPTKRIRPPREFQRKAAANAGA